LIIKNVQKKFDYKYSQQFDQNPYGQLRSFRIASCHVLALLDKLDQIKMKDKLDQFHESASDRLASAVVMGRFNLSIYYTSITGNRDHSNQETFTHSRSEEIIIITYYFFKCYNYGI